MPGLLLALLLAAPPEDGRMAPFEAKLGQTVYYADEWGRRVTVLKCEVIKNRTAFERYAYGLESYGYHPTLAEGYSHQAWDELSAVFRTEGEARAYARRKNLERAKEIIGED